MRKKPFFGKKYPRKFLNFRANDFCFLSRCRMCSFEGTSSFWFVIRHCSYFFLVLVSFEMWAKCTGENDCEEDPTKPVCDPSDGLCKGINYKVFCMRVQECIYKRGGLGAVRFGGESRYLGYESDNRLIPAIQSRRDRLGGVLSVFSAMLGI